MDGPALEHVLDEHLDILGQQPFLKIYTQICSCYAVSDGCSYPDIVNTLASGLGRLSTSFPWVAGQVVNDGASEGNTGIFKIVPFESIPRLVVKDLRNDPSAPTMDDMRRAKFPFRMLDESVIAPRHTIPTAEEAVDLAPVFLVQATFITGGVILTFVAAHNTMDMTGQGQVIDLLSKACRVENFTSEELSTGNLTRSNVIPFLDDSYKHGPELDNQIIKATLPATISNGPPPTCGWAYFVFDHTSLAILKALTTRSITIPSSYISTDDALTAFIWKSVMRARLPRLDPETEVTFGRAVDVRRYLGVPQTYPGLVQNMTYHTYTLKNLLDEPLGGVASNLRSAVDPKTSTLAYNTRALATFMNRLPDKNRISFSATLNLSSDIMLSSWAKVDLHDLDFGLGLGKPEAVRRPQFMPVESLFYLMPRRPDGEIAVALCLRDEDLERLKMDEEFMKYSEYVG
jgi:trichothecene 3-O-acetyltransferase